MVKFNGAKIGKNLRDALVHGMHYISANWHFNCININYYSGLICRHSDEIYSL